VVGAFVCGAARLSGPLDELILLAAFPPRDLNRHGRAGSCDFRRGAGGPIRDSYPFRQVYRRKKQKYLMRLQTYTAFNAASPSLSA